MGLFKNKINYLIYANEEQIITGYPTGGAMECAGGRGVSEVI